MALKIVTQKHILVVFSVLFYVVTSNAQTNLPYFTNFEGGNGGWVDGGSASAYVTNTSNSPQGDNSWELKDDAGNASSFYQDFNLSGYDTVSISFSFQSNGFDPSFSWFIFYIAADAFEVSLDGTRVLLYTFDADWDSNNERNTLTITLNADDYNFKSNSEIRFESLANNVNDMVYFDEISVTGTNRVKAPIADFLADNTTPFTYDVVAFSDLSDFTPTRWEWSYSGPGAVTYVNGTSSTSQNPEVTFDAAGEYTVSLTAANTAGSNTLIKTNYITVGAYGSDNPVSFTATTSTTTPYTFLELSATANANGDHILVAYNTTNSFGTPTSDVNGTITINGSGTLIFQGDADDINTNTLPQLNQNRTYYFKAWSIGTEGFSRGIEANAKTRAVEAPGSFSATASAFNNTITFNSAANSLNDNLMLVYNTSNDFGIPQDGVLYQIDDAIGNATVLLNTVNAETINNYVHDFLLLDTTYYYQLWSLADGIWYYSQSFKADNTKTINGAIWQNAINTDDTEDDIPYTLGEQVADNIEVSGVVLGSGLRVRGANNEISVDRISTGNSLNTNNNDYIEFTLTPNAGFEISFNEFFFDSSDSGGSINYAALRSSIDNFESNIGGEVDADNGANFNLMATKFQTINEKITFRLYLWDASSSNADFNLKDFGFIGTISTYAIWDGASWSNTKGPDLATRAVIDGDYNTSSGGYQTSFRCKSLTINAGKTLIVDNNTFVEVNYNALGAGNLTVATKGAFVQRNDGVFNITGTAKVNKNTAFKSQWYHYTYWSSPVTAMDVNVAFAGIKRRYYWDGTRWMYMGGGAMVPARGYTITGKTSGVQNVSFTGAFNTGNITTPIYYNATSGESWNLIGNPYPSALDLNQFLGTNSNILQGAAYFWSQETPPADGEFSGTDYIPFNATGSVSTSPDLTKIFNGFVPSAQSFFIAGKAAGEATFTNAMRMADATSNSQFFKSASTPPKGVAKSNKLWLNLASNNGVFSQILVGYVNGATNGDDGLRYDATKFGEGSGAYMYSTIENSNKKFVIQGKDANSLDINEVISLGFNATVSNTFSISIATLQGEFLKERTIYIKDKHLNITHNLSANNYVFTSDAGEFNERFQIVFKSETLSTSNFEKNDTQLKVIQLGKGAVTFSTTNKSIIKTINIYNSLGQHVKKVEANAPSKTCNFNSKVGSFYVAQVKLVNGGVLTKKFIIR